jgi:hypothetical protein
MTGIEQALSRGTRRVRKLARIGGAAQCCVCGETDWRCLDLHEPSGREAGKPRVALSVVLCRNCHAKATDLQFDHPRHANSATLFMRGVADLMRLAADQLDQEELKA